MEKITKKKKKSRRLRRRIGLIAIGGMSLVLTVCLSVGATLAWFAGSTWAGNDLYMGGPVYVEMAGRGAASGTAGDGSSTAKWVGGDGKLDIIASARNTGTAKGTGTSGNNMNNYYNGGSGTSINDYDTSNVLLPGQKLLIYSQARVYSTAYADNLDAGNYTNQSSGANTTNISNGTTTYTSSKGVKKTTTTSVLRAKFSINVEFDPTVGFNNFNDDSYANGYPVQSADYKGDAVGASGATYYSALGASGISGSYQNYTGRRDAVENTVVNSSYTASCTVSTVTGSISKWSDANKDTTDNDVRLWAIKEGKSTSIYKWKYVSEKVYNAALSYKKGTSTTPYTVTEDGVTYQYVPMAAPFNGDYNTLGGKSANVTGGTGNGYFGVWVMDSTGTNHIESDSFYKARCTAYIQSYKAHYEDEYDRNLILSIGAQITQLEDALNTAFVNLVNQSSDNILDGMVKGYTANDAGEIHYVSGGSKTAATWLYVDSTIGQDTNASDSSTNVGGWWYLVESDSTNKVATGKNEVKTVIDNVSGVTTTSETTGITSYDWDGNVNGAVNNPTENSYTIVRAKGAAGSGYTSTAKEIADTDTRILNAKLFEITPDASNGVLEAVGSNTGTYKVVSVSFPFVNGNFELPGKELTNIFANAKISFQITFQALQAFFPFTPSIDGCASGSALAGTGKALNITNAIPIFNEAFDYLSFLSN